MARTAERTTTSLFIHLKACKEIVQRLAEFGTASALAIVASGLKKKEPSK